MNLKILDSIMHGELKPWKLDTTDKKRFVELVKTAKTVPPVTYSELVSQVAITLEDFPIIRKLLIGGTLSNVPISKLPYEIDLPKYKDTITHFYYSLITGETLRVYNSTMLLRASITELVDIRYQIGKTLVDIRVLAKQVSIELNELGFSIYPNEQSSFTHYALYYLKHSLIQLYFSIQKNFESSLLTTTTLEDFYVLDLEEPLSSIVPLELLTNLESEIIETKINQEEINFGFKDDVTKLITVINQLCSQIHLINEDISSADDLINVLISKRLLPRSYTIKLDCETKIFRYVIDKLQPYFSELSLANIQKSEIFYSKLDIENKPITSGNLSSSKNKSAVEPKEKATIDKIFKYLQ